MKNTKIVNLLAIFISLCALATSIWQANITERAVSLSVQPFIQFTPYLEGPGGRNGIFMENIGLGPAIFKSAKIYIDQKEYDLSNISWESALQSLKIDDLCFSKSWIPVDAGLIKEKEVQLIKLSNSAPPSCTCDLINLLESHKISIETTYESMTKATHKKLDEISIGTVKNDISRLLERKTPRQLSTFFLCPSIK